MSDAMGNASAEEKLRLIDTALKHFYDVDGDELIAKYQMDCQARVEKKKTPAVQEMDHDAAISFLKGIPEKCYQSESIKIVDGMLGAVSESEIVELRDQLTKAHPDISLEIRSMFDFCLNAKRLSSPSS